MSRHLLASIFVLLDQSFLLFKCLLFLEESKLLRNGHAVNSLGSRADRGVSHVLEVSVVETLGKVFVRDAHDGFILWLLEDGLGGTFFFLSRCFSTSELRLRLLVWISLSHCLRILRDGRKRIVGYALQTSTAQDLSLFEFV